MFFPGLINPLTSLGKISELILASPFKGRIRFNQFISLLKHQNSKYVYKIFKEKIPHRRGFLSDSQSIFRGMLLMCKCGEIDPVLQVNRYKKTPALFREQEFK
jgi:hypothetical protein